MDETEWVSKGPLGVILETRTGRGRTKTEGRLKHEGLQDVPYRTEDTGS